MNKCKPFIFHQSTNAEMCESPFDAVASFKTVLLGPEQRSSNVVATELSNKLRSRALSIADLTSSFIQVLNQATPGQQENAVMDLYAGALEGSLELMSTEDEEEICKIIVDLFSRVQGTERLLRILLQLSEQGCMTYPTFAGMLESMQAVMRIAFRTPAFINVLFDLFINVVAKPFKGEKISVMSLLDVIISSFMGVRDPSLMVKLLDIVGKLSFCIGDKLTGEIIAKGAGMMSSYFPIMYHPVKGQPGPTLETLKGAHIRTCFSNLGLLDDVVNMALDSLFESDRAEAFRDGCLYLQKALHLKKSFLDNTPDFSSPEATETKFVCPDEDGEINIKKFIDEIAFTDEELFDDKLSLEPLGQTVALDMWNCLAASACEKGTLVPEAKELVRLMLIADMNDEGQHGTLTLEVTNYLVREFEFDSGNATVRAGISTLIGAVKYVNGIPEMLVRSCPYCVSALNSHRWFEYIPLSCSLVAAISLEPKICGVTCSVLQALINHLPDKKGAGWKMLKITKAVRRVCGLTKEERKERGEDENDNDEMDNTLVIPSGLIKRLISNGDEEEISLLRALKLACPITYNKRLEEEKHVEEVNEEVVKGPSPSDEELSEGDDDKRLSREEEVQLPIYMASSLSDHIAYLKGRRVSCDGEVCSEALSYNEIRMIIRTTVLQLKEEAAVWGPRRPVESKQKDVQELIVLILGECPDVSDELLTEAVGELLEGYLSALLGRNECGCSKGHEMSNIVGTFAYEFGQLLRDMERDEDQWGRLMLRVTRVVCRDRTSTIGFVCGLLPKTDDQVKGLIDDSVQILLKLVGGERANDNIVHLLPLLCCASASGRSHMATTINRLYDSSVEEIERCLWENNSEEVTRTIPQNLLIEAEAATVLLGALALSDPPVQVFLPCVDKLKRLMNLNGNEIDGIQRKLALYLDHAIVYREASSVSSQAIFMLLTTSIGFVRDMKNKHQKETSRMLLNSVVQRSSQADLQRLDVRDITTCINSLAKLGKKAIGGAGTGKGLTKLVTLPTNPARESLKEILCIFVPIVYILRDAGRWEELMNYVDLITILSSNCFPTESRLFMKRRVLDCLLPCLEAPTKSLRDRVRKARFSWYLL